MEQTLPTRGEMERSLSQYIQAFYRNQLGCRTGKISCYLLDRKVAIAIENSITPVERLLDNPNHREFARDLRHRIDAIVKRELLSGLGTILKVEVVDLTIDTTLDNNFTGIIVLLCESPNLRASRHLSKFKSQKNT